MPDEDFDPNAPTADEVRDPAPPVPDEPMADEAAVGTHVLTQSEVDDLVEKVNTLETALADAQAGLKTKDDMIASLDAEMAGLKQTNRLLVAAADGARGDLARHTATGAPARIEDLPKLGDIPAHKSLEDIHAVDAPAEASGDQPVATS